MKHWKRWTVLALALLLLASGMWRAWSKHTLRQEMAEQSSQQALAAKTLDLLAQDLWRADTMPLETGVDFTGTTRALRSAVVKARVAGELQGLAVHEGDSVRAGDVLARTDDTDARARLQQAEEQAQAVKAQVAIAQRQYDNNQALVQQGFISATALDTSRASLDSSRANWQAAQSNVSAARKVQQDTVLRAPITGLVATRLAQNGEHVPVDGKVLEIVDPESLEIEAALPPAAALLLKTGQMAQWTVEGQAGSAPARVARINPNLQTGSRSVLAYLSLPSQAGLRQGMFVQGRVLTGEVQAVAVPLSAVHVDKPTPYVQAVVDGRVQHLPVTPGTPGRARDEELVAVNLTPGSMVLRASVGLLPPGTAVRLPADVPSGSH